MSAAMAMRRLLMQGASDGHLRLFDVQLASRLTDLETQPDAQLLLAIALCSYAVGRGDTCLSLSGCAQFEFFTAESDPQRHELATDAGLSVAGRRILPPPAPRWRQHLLDRAIVGLAGDPTPLILHGDDRLYLGRYFELEQRLLSRLQHFIERDSALLSASLSVAVRDDAGGKSDPAPGRRNLQKLAVTLRQVFNASTHSDANEQSIYNTGTASPDNTDWQCVAAAIGSTAALSIITGGPGTGKTYTVAALLACVAEQYGASYRPRVALAAPTGKAATRLTESIRNACDKLPVTNAVKDYIGVEAQTLHRLLSIVPGRVQPRYHHGRRLPFDVVIVDEASMVDLPMMTRLFDALPDDASVVLLGDKDQLSSVESGMVLGDICGDRAVTEFSRPLANAIEAVTGQRVNQADRVTPVSNNIVYLRHSYRSQDGGGITALASAINKGCVQTSINCLRSDTYDNVTLISHNELSGLLKTEVVPHYHKLPQLALTDDSEIHRHLDVLGDVSVLCALRQGSFGATGINEALRRLLVADRKAADSGLQYPGRPVMIRENNAPMRLYNGDTGLVLPVITDDGESLLRVYFAGAGAGASAGSEGSASYRSFATARLPAHESAYAMTIHKSQGSEFNTVVVVLPEEDSPLLSRELLYTAVTRAKKKIVVVASEAILNIAISRRAVRQSGLRDALWPPAKPDLMINEPPAKPRASPAKKRSKRSSRNDGPKPEQGAFDF